MSSIAPPAPPRRVQAAQPRQDAAAAEAPSITIEIGQVVAAAPRPPRPAGFAPPPLSLKTREAS
jgi:hypothetical protein